jgi:hypothetical protein
MSIHPLPQSRRCPPPSFLNTIDERRYAFLAAKCRAAGLTTAAEMAEKWAEEHRLAGLRIKALEAEDRA